MQLNNFNYPLFGLRAYARVFEEYPYKLIQTKERIYVLDIINSELPFVERRLKLLTSDSGYPIYSLKERFTSLAQVLNSSKRTFIDSTGKMVKIERKKYYKTKVSKVMGFDSTHDGRYLLFTLRDSFICNMLYNYLVTINFNGVDILVGGVEDPTTARRNYKI
jgi:hypothetical protein